MLTPEINLKSPMLKYLLWFALGLGIWWFWRHRSRPAPSEAPKKIPPQPDTMGCCTHCGVYCPKQDMVADTEGLLYCTQDHLQQYHKHKLS